MKKFKSGALLRHETFNGMTKRFKCLDGRFRHSPDRFAACFESVCVICQCQMENGQPLFDVLIEDVMQKKQVLKEVMQKKALMSSRTLL